MMRWSWRVLREERRRKRDVMWDRIDERVDVWAAHKRAELLEWQLEQKLKE